jgi:CrcB protein
VTVAVWAGVAILGGVGAILRFVVDGRIAARTGRSFPFGTLAINLAGSLLLGALVGGVVAGDAFVLAGTATLGSFTTFSTWMYESQRMVEDGRARDGGLNLALSLGLGVGAAALGRWIGGQL